MYRPRQQRLAGTPGRLKAKLDYLGLTASSQYKDNIPGGSAGRDFSPEMRLHCNIVSVSGRMGRDSSLLEPQYNVLSVAGNVGSAVSLLALQFRNFRRGGGAGTSESSRSC